MEQLQQNIQKVGTLPVRKEPPPVKEFQGENKTTEKLEVAERVVAETAAAPMGSGDADEMLLDDNLDDMLI